MTKDYIVRNITQYNVLGHKVNAVEEIFSDEYLNSDRFQSRCLRCCFYEGPSSFSGDRICRYINCNGGRGDIATHFELDE